MRQHDKLVCELELSIDREAYSLAQADVYAYWAQIAVIANALCTQVSESPVAVRIV